MPSKKSKVFIVPPESKYFRVIEKYLKPLGIDRTDEEINYKMFICNLDRIKNPNYSVKAEVSTDVTKQRLTIKLNYTDYSKFDFTRLLSLDMHGLKASGGLTLMFKVLKEFNRDFKLSYESEDRKSTVTISLDFKCVLNEVTKYDLDARAFDYISLDNIDKRDEYIIPFDLLRDYLSINEDGHLVHNICCMLDEFMANIFMHNYRKHNKKVKIVITNSGILYSALEVQKW